MHGHPTAIPGWEYIKSLFEIKMLQDLGINETLLIQFALFIATYLVLSNILVKPYLKLFKKRDEETHGSMIQSRELEEENKLLEQKLQDMLMERRKKFHEVTKRLRDEGVTEEEKILAAAREQMHKQLDEGRGLIDEQIKKMMEEFDQEAIDVASSIAAALIGKDSGEQKENS